MNVTLSADHRIFDGQVGGNATFNSFCISIFHCVSSLLLIAFMKPVSFQLRFCLNCAQTLRMFEDFFCEKIQLFYQMNLLNKPWTPRAHLEPELLVYRISSDQHVFICSIWFLTTEIGFGLQFFL